MIDKLETQKLLSEKFDVNEVKQRDAGFGGKKLDYIAIDSVLNRLNTILPLGYSWHVDSTIQIGENIVVTGTLSIFLGGGEFISRSGVGADKIGSDMDKTVKTAYAEALKKACNTLGIGLYLWDADERAEIARERLNGTVDVKRKFEPAQLEKMKSIRKQFNLNTDDELNAFLKNEYKVSGITTKADLSPSNIESFFVWSDKRIAKTTKK